MEFQSRKCSSWPKETRKKNKWKWKRMRKKNRRIMALRESILMKTTRISLICTKCKMKDEV
jgi:hypothetical protein